MKNKIILILVLVSIGSNVVAQNLNKSFSISFFTINRYAQSTTNFDKVDDIRSFTSEALFLQSKFRLNRPLTQEELAKIIRTKEQIETFNNLRIHLNPLLAIDISYKYRNIQDAQITNFFEPNKFNNVKVNEYGVAIQASTDIKQYGFLVRGSYKRINKKGGIEFFPDRDEDINQYEFNALVARTLGEEKLCLYATYVFQDIQLNISNPYNRDRDIYAFFLSYGKQDQDKVVSLENKIRPTSAVENIFERRFDRRGLRFFSGLVFDIETFGDVNVKKNDYFIGTSLCAWINDKNCLIAPFDISIESDIFTSEIDEDSFQDNAQYRTNLTVYYQINKPFTLLIPVKYDIAIDGPDDFENWKVGIELRYSNVKWLNARYYVSIRYDYQSFFHLNRNLNLFNFNISIRF